MSEKNVQRLHPISILLDLLSTMKSMIIPIIILVGGRGFNYSLNPDSENFLITIFYITAAPLVICILIGFNYIEWRKFVYWFEESELRVEYGLFIKKKRYIPFERIQSLNYKEGIFHRALKLVEVSVETASDSKNEGEAELTAITRQQADEIEFQMKLAKQSKINLDRKEQKTHRQPQQIVKKPLYKMSNKELILLASTSSSMGILFSVIIAITSQLNDIIPYGKIYDEVQHLVKFGLFIIIILVLATVLLSWIVAIAISYIANYGFNIVKEDQNLFIAKGLVEKKQITVPMNRIQGINIIENPIRQLFGYCRVVLISAGGSGEKDEEKIVLLPFVSKKKAIIILSELFPNYVWHHKKVKPPRKSLIRYLLKPQYYLIFPVILCSVLLFPFGLFSLLFSVLFLILSYSKYRTAAFTIYDSQIAIIFRNISKNTFITEKKRIQSVTQSQSLFAERKDVASILIHVMSGNSNEVAYAKHFDLEDIEEVMNWYKVKK